MADISTQGGSPLAVIALWRTRAEALTAAARALLARRACGASCPLPTTRHAPDLWLEQPAACDEHGRGPGWCDLPDAAEVRALWALVAEVAGG